MEEEQITQLVIDDLVGDITPEDAIMLQKLLRENPAAVNLRNHIIRLLTEGDMQGILDEEITVERAFTKLKEQKNKTRRHFRGPGAALMILLLLGAGFFFYLHWQQTVISDNSKALQAAMYKYALLRFEDGNFIRLDKINGNEIPNLSVDKQRRIVYVKGPISGFERVTLTTARGESYQLVTPDDTRSHVDAKTSFTFFCTRDVSAREVAVSGRVFIDVKPDPKHPFIVNLPQAHQVNVLGTSFNINTDEQHGTQVALSTGKVAVKGFARSMILEPGFAASWQNGTNIRKTTFDKETVLSWLQGRYTCSKATLRDLAQQMERCFPYQVSIDIPVADDTARFIEVQMVRGTDITEFLDAALEYPSDYKFTHRFDKDSILHISLKNAQ